MRGLIRYALHQPLIIVLATLVFAAAGVIAFKNLSVEAFPDVTDTQVTVIALYPGRAAEEVEKQVTLPLETALSGLPNSIRLFSHTQFGLSFTVITYDDNSNVNIVRQQVAERLSSVNLPAGAELTVAPNATPVGEIMRFRLRGDGQTPTNLRTQEDWVVERALRQVPGVADVVSMGGFIKQYEVQPDLDKLRAYKLTFQNLLDALGRGNSNAGGSYVAQGGQQFAIRGIGLLKSPEDIGRIVLSSRGGTPILIRDVAQVKIGAVPRLGITGQDQDDNAVVGIVIMRKGENPSVVLKGVKERIADLNHRVLPKGVQIVPFYDRAWLMDKTITTVFHNLVEGALLVSIVLYLFLSNLRASLAVVIVIPLALLATFLGSEDHGRAGQPAESGRDGLRHHRGRRGDRDREHIAPAVGARRGHECGRAPQRGDQRGRGSGSTDVVLDADHHRRAHPDLCAAAARGADFSADGAVGIDRAGGLLDLFADAGAAARILAAQAQIAARRQPPGVAHKRLYAPVLEWALNARRTVVIIALGVFAVAMVAASRLGSEFLPELNEGTIWVNFDMPASVSQREAIKILRMVRTALGTVPEVRTVVSKAGQPEDGTDPKTLSMAEVFVDVKPQEQWRAGMTRDKLLDELEQKLSVIPSVDPAFSQPIRDNVLESISQIKGQIVVKVSGDDLNELRRIAESMRREFKQVAGVQRAEVDRLGELPQLVIDIDRDRAARVGLNVGDVQDVIEAALAGKAATDLWEGERKFSVAVRLPADQRAVAALPNTPIALPDGGYTTLGAVSNIHEASGAMNIAREGGKRTMAIGVFIKGRDMGSVVADMQERVAKNVNVPDNYAVNWSGEFENQERAMKRLAVVVPISLLLIFVLLFDAFKSFKTASLILINVPLALIGGFVALYAFGIPLSVSAAIGFIALSGQAVLNGVVMLSGFQLLQAGGLSVVEAVRQGAMQRLRTVLMTALLAALGLLPMALSRDIGSETQRPLALVVIGGLITATLLTLVVLPALYVSWFGGKREKAAQAARPTSVTHPASIH